MRLYNPMMRHLDTMPVQQMMLYNTATRRLEPLIPIKPPSVTMYACGPTVYDDAHIGHARTFLAWDLLYRTLNAIGYRVKYARNITDFDDKIVKRAALEGVGMDTLAFRYIQRFGEDMGALNLLPAIEPTASSYVEDMREMVKSLLGMGFAYQVRDGSVFFRVSKIRDYGRLSGRTEDSLKTGARVDPHPDKEHPADFALWRPTRLPLTPPASLWVAPDGNWFGRPGWHTECVAMIHRVLGGEIDIHCGGEDLLFPHHENELAQHQALTGNMTLARCWLHSAHVVTPQGEKMSKSQGNQVTIRELLDEVDGDAIRYYLFQSHYRQPLTFSREALRGCQTRVDKIRQKLRGTVLPASEPPSSAVLYALRDDLGAPRALAYLNSQLRRPQFYAEALAGFRMMGFGF